MNAQLRNGVAIAALGAWLGAAGLLAASVAPAAFSVLPTRTLAGNLVGVVLPVVFYGGMGAGLLAVYLRAVTSRLRYGLAATIVLACAVAQFEIGPRVARVLATDAPRGASFGQLHAISVGLLGLAMLAALILLSLLLRGPQASAFRSTPHG